MLIFADFQKVSSRRGIGLNL